MFRITLDFERGEIVRGTRIWLVIGLLALALAGLTVAGCGDDDDDGGDTTSAGGAEDFTLIQDGTLTVGTDTPFPPFEIGQPPDISGYDIDVLNAIADQLGLTPEYTDTAFDTIFRDVAAGQYDIAAAASTITPGRQKTVDFSDPYYEAQQALLVPEGSDIQSVDDLSGKIVGAQDGTTGETYANDETDASEVRGFPEGPDAVAAMVSGQVEAVIIDQPVAVDAVEKQGGVEIVEEIATNELYGYAISKENPGLVQAVNDALQTLKDDGTITELYQQYFKADPPDSVLSGTTDNPS
jgi:polar amino acid transport system substrate-binding protein